MRVLILYSTKTGTTEKAARELAGYFNDVEVRNIKSGKVSPEKYDVVVVGSYIRNRTFDPALKNWLARYEKMLYEKKVCVFFCNAFIELVPSILMENFPEAFIEECLCIDSFGGELHMESLGFFEKLGINADMKKRKGRNVLPCLREDRIEIFAQTIKMFEEE